MYKDIAVSIVVHKTAPDELRRAIGCVLVCPRVAMVHVIDNSPDNSLQMEFGTGAGKQYMGRLSYRHVENRGFGAGHNIAINESISSGMRYHLVMNADVEWQGDVIGTLASYMDRHGDIGLIAPKIFYPDGDLQLTTRRLPTPWDVFAKRFLPYKLIRKRMELYLLCGADHDRIIDSPYLLGSFMLFRVSALEECGNFDERFFMYPEDIDITRRIHESSRTVYYPFANIIHRHAAESRRSLKMLRIHAFNMIKYFNKWGWWIDKKRRLYNRRLDASITLVDYSERPRQRG